MDGKDPSAPRHADVADGCSWLFHVVSCCFMLFRESCGFRVSPFLTMFVALERCRMVLLTPRSNGGLGAMSKDPVVHHVSPIVHCLHYFALLYHVVPLHYLRQKGPVNLWEKRSSDFVRSPCSGDHWRLLVLCSLLCSSYSTYFILSKESKSQKTRGKVAGPFEHQSPCLLNVGFMNLL